ncbi:MAG: response regulator [Lachnospiraceae bacterium]|nr:response regulator [Lachnospiraceae bacterium]
MLTTMIVDENPLSLVYLANLCTASQKLGSVYIYNNAAQAMTGVRTSRIDFALLSIKEPGTAELQLGDWLRKRYPDVVLVYVTSSERLCMEALRHGADYFVTNPYQDKEVEGAIDRAVLLYRRHENRLYVHTFGRFYVFYSGSAVYFRNRKSRELMALCVDRCGGNVSMEEVIDVLWPEKPYDNRVKIMYRNAVLCLRQTLNLLGQTNVFVANRGECHINPGEIQCDYYEYLDGVERARKSYHREYMFEYTWAEQTNIRLTKEIYGETGAGICNERDRIPWPEIAGR